MGKYAKLLKGAGALAVFSVIAKLIGAFYRIPLTNIIGAEGIGLYQMVFPLYTVLLTISSGGLPVAISKVVSGLLVKKDEQGARRVLKVSLISLLILGAIGMVIIFAFRNMIAYLQGNNKAAVAYIGIAPSLLFVAVISAFRGYFQGTQNMFPSALSQVVEQLIKLLCGLLLARLLLPYGIEYAVLGAVLGVSVSELAAMLILLVQYMFVHFDYKKRNVFRLERIRNAMEAGESIVAPQSFAAQSTGAILKSIYQIAIPVTLGSLVLPLTQVADSILVINMLVGSGVDRTDATRLFGIINGPINSIINMPVVVTLSIAVALLPMISSAMAAKDKEKIPALVGSAFKYALLIGIPCALVFGVFSHEIISILYKRGLSESQIDIGSKLLRIGALSVVFVSILQVATSVLQGTGRAHIPAINLLVGAVVKILTTLFLLPRIGIYGAIIGTVACYAVTGLLDVLVMLKYTSVRVRFWKLMGAPLCSAAVMIGITYLLHWALVRFLPLIVSFIAALVVGGIAYIACIFLFRGITKKEIVSLIKKS